MATLNTGMTATETFGTTSPVSGSAPTAVDGTDGQPVQWLGAVTVTISAPSGQTFSGAGNLDCYVLFQNIASPARWSRYKGGDIAVASASGFRDFTFDAVELVGRDKGAYVKWVPNAVTFSGGSTGVVVVQQGSPNQKIWT